MISEEVLYVLHEIQQEVKQETGEEFSIEEIHDIAHSQFSASVFAFKKGVEVRLPFFGTFIRKYRKQKIDLLLKLKEYKKTATPQDYKEKKKRINAHNIALSKKRKLERRGSKISTEDFLSLPNLITVTDKYKDL